MRGSIISLAFSVLIATASLAWAEEKPTEAWFTASDGAKIHYRESGKGVAVVLIHGAGGSSQGWFRNGIAQELAKNHRVVALDCRGHGLSDEAPSRLPNAPRRNPPNGWWWTDVVELMDHLKIEKAHFHGYSWGGTITEHMLAVYPERMITAAIGGWGIPEEDPEMKAKVPPDSTDTDPRDAELMAGIKARHA